MILLFFLLAFSMPIFAQNLPYPEIHDLEANDIFFNQYTVAVANSRKTIAVYDSSADITPEFYTYRVKAEDTILSIAARCCIPYDALVTLNRIASADEDITGKLIILPSLPALYVYKKPESTLENLIANYVDQVASPFKGFEFPVFTAPQQVSFVYCLPNALFDGTARSFFFQPYYRYPLDTGWVSSPFGMRRDPFTGRNSYHSGIDIAAPRGTPVHVIAGGVVTEVAYNNILGKHIIVQHKDGRESVYGHLSQAFVVVGETVKSGKTIGAVGSTGRSTGNHLHLEIRESHIALDPAKFLKRR